MIGKCSVMGGFTLLQDSNLFDLNIALTSIKPFNKTMQHTQH
jgi:hypothetical protein